MLAKDVIAKLQKMVAAEGNKEVVVAGVFNGGKHDFDIFSGKDYYSDEKPVAGMIIPTIVGNNFVIDQL